MTFESTPLHGEVQAIDRQLPGPAVYLQVDIGQQCLAQLQRPGLEAQARIAQFSQGAQVVRVVVPRLLARGCCQQGGNVELLGFQGGDQPGLAAIYHGQVAGEILLQRIHLQRADIQAGDPVLGHHRSGDAGDFQLFFRPGRSLPVMVLAKIYVEFGRAAQCGKYFRGVTAAAAGLDDAAGAAVRQCRFLAEQFGQVRLLQRRLEFQIDCLPGGTASLQAQVGAAAEGALYLQGHEAAGIGPLQGDGAAFNGQLAQLQVADIKLPVKIHIGQGLQESGQGDARGIVFGCRRQQGVQVQMPGAELATEPARCVAGEAGRAANLSAGKLDVQRLQGQFVGPVVQLRGDDDRGFLLAPVAALEVDLALQCVEQRLPVAALGGDASAPGMPGPLAVQEGCGEPLRCLSRLDLRNQVQSPTAGGTAQPGTAAEVTCRAVAGKGGQRYALSPRGELQDIARPHLLVPANFIDGQLALVGGQVQPRQVLGGGAGVGLIVIVQQDPQAVDIQGLYVGGGLLRQGPAFLVAAVDPGL